MGVTSFGKAADDYINKSTYTGETSRGPITPGYTSPKGFSAEPMSLGGIYDSMGIGMTAPNNASITNPMNGVTSIQPQNAWQTPEYKNMLQSQSDLADYSLGRQQDWDNSFMGQASPYIKGFAGVTHGLGSLAGIYTGFKQLDIAERQVGIAEEQWGETKSELARVKQVRTDMNAKYTA